MSSTAKICVVVCRASPSGVWRYGCSLPRQLRCSHDYLLDVAGVGWFYGSLSLWRWPTSSMACQWNSTLSISGRLEPSACFRGLYPATKAIVCVLVTYRWAAPILGTCGGSTSTEPQISSRYSYWLFVEDVASQPYASNGRGFCMPLG